MSKIIIAIVILIVVFVFLGWLWMGERGAEYNSPINQATTTLDPNAITPDKLYPSDGKE